MYNIIVRTLDDNEITVDGKRIQFPYRKADGLFFYLCVEKKASREKLVNLLWSDFSESKGKKYLRDCLYKIKKSFGFEILVSNGTNIYLNKYYSFYLDFENIHKDTYRNVYMNDFLTGLNIKNCPEFENWILDKRDTYKKSYINILKSFFKNKTYETDIDEIEKISNDIINYDIYNESNYRDIMNYYCYRGYYNKSINLYNKLEEVLKNDLDVSPDNQTVNLYKEILVLKKSNSNNSTNSFIGRFAEINKVNKSLSDSSNNKAYYLITGEIGSGKTNFIENINNVVSTYDYYCAVSKCFEVEKIFRLSAWNSIFTQFEKFFFDCNIQIPKSWYDVLSYLFPSFGKDYEINTKVIEYIENSKHQIIYDVIFSVFKKLSNVKKIVLFFDDIQFADNFSLRLISLISNRFKNIIFFFTCCDDYLKDMEHFFLQLSSCRKQEKIHLDRLTFNETKYFISQYCNYTFNENIISRIYQKSEGNILFIIELLNLLKEDNSILGYTEKVENIIKTIISKLTESQKNLLDFISIFLKGVEFQDIVSIYNISKTELLELINSLQDKNIIKETINNSLIKYSFSHSMIREYIYSNLRESVKTIYHNNIGCFLETKFKSNYNYNLNELIYHFERAKDFKKYLKYILLKMNYYYPIRHELFQSGYQYEDKLNIENTFKSIKDNIEKIEKDDNLYKIYLMQYNYLYGCYNIKNGDYKNGLNQISMASKIAIEIDDDNYLLYTYKQFVFFGIQVHNIIIINKYIQKCFEINSKLKIEKEQGTLNRLKGIYYIKTNEFEKANIYIHKALDIFKKININENKYFINIAACFNFLGDIYKLNYNYQYALKYYNKAIKICAENDIKYGLAIFLTNKGMVKFEINQTKEAKSILLEAIELYEMFDIVWGRPYAECYLSKLYSLEGLVDKALIHLKNAEDLASKINNPIFINLVNETKKNIFNN